MIINYNFFIYNDFNYQFLKSMAQSDFSKTMGQLEALLDKYLREKAPKLPKDWQEFLVKLSPYLAILGVIVLAPTVLAAFGLSTFVVPFRTMGGMMTGRPFLGLSYLLSVLFVAVQLVLIALAISPLFKRAKKGWRYLYYATLLGGVSSLIGFDFGGLIIGTGLSLYILFQVKEYYQ